MAVPAVAQNNNNNNNNNNDGTSYNYRQGAVGGVLIGSDGILQNATVDQTGRLQQLMKQATTPASEDLKEFNPMRKVSLRKLEAAIQELVREGKPIPADIFYLAGLQQIEYVFVYPEQKDIVLAGPGEGWTVGKDGVVVGETTGRPVMTLDDLAIALRSAEGAQREAIRLLDRSAARRRRSITTVCQRPEDDRLPTANYRQHRASPWSSDDQRHRRARHEPLRSRSGCGRLSNEADRNELRAVPRPRLAELPGHDEIAWAQACQT